jgi:hypothetical protein
MKITVISTNNPQQGMTVSSDAVDTRANYSITKTSSIVSDGIRRNVLLSPLSIKERRQALLISFGCYALLIMYPIIVKTCASFFDCIFVPSSGIYILRSDESFICYDSSWYAYLVLVLLAIILYVVGIPLFMYALLALLRRGYPLGSLYKPGQALDNFYQYTAFLSKKYHPLMFNYEVVLLVYYGALAINSVTAHRYSTRAAAFMLSQSTIVFIYQIVHMMTQPFRTAQLNSLNCLLLLLVQCGLLLALVLEMLQLDSGSPHRNTFSYVSFILVIGTGTVLIAKYWHRYVSFSYCKSFINKPYQLIYE